MTKRLRFLLLCAGLAAVTAVGAWFVLSTGRQVPASLANLHDSKEQADKKADRLAAEILKRPLFTEDRQPPHPKIVIPQPPKLQGRLAGVTLRPDSRVALFTRPGGKPVSVKEGDVIDGWTTTKIEADRVTLTSAFGEQVVKPTNGGTDELTPGRPIKKPAAKPQPAKPAQTQAPAQKSPQLANRTTGQK